MNKFSKLIYVVIGIVLTIVAMKTFYDASLVNNKKGWYVIEGSIIDTSLQVTHPQDIYYVKEDSVDYNKNVNQFEYSLLADGTVSIDKYNGKSSILVIPSEINGVQITSIWGNAFYNKWITSVIIPDTVTSIWNSAFSYNDLAASIMVGVGA